MSEPFVISAKAMTTICGIARFDGQPVETRHLEGMLAPFLRRSPRLVSSADRTVAFASLDEESPAATSIVSGLSAGGPRPLVVSDSRIDNRAELRSRLSISPAGTGEEIQEAEILRAAYERFGASWHRHLRGAFAIALWDAGRRQLVLLRDPMGERSLYWARREGCVVFSSEPIQVVAGTGSTPQPDLSRMLAYLAQAVPAPTSTFLAGVQRVPEGHQTLITEASSTCEPCWDWSSVAAPAVPAKESAEALGHTLQAAVERRLAPCGGQGILLSGGIDSISVAHFSALALAATSRELTAFTWTSQRGDGIDETALSRLFIESRSNVREHPIPADELWPLSRHPAAYTDPNGPLTNTYPDLLLQTLEEARGRNVHVLANGLGGDPVAGWLAPELSLLLRGRFSALAQRWRGLPWRRRSLVHELRAATRRQPFPAEWSERARRMAREDGLDSPPLLLRTFATRDARRRALISGHFNALALERFDFLHRRTGVRIVAPWQDTDVALLVLGLTDRGFPDLAPAKALQRRALRDHVPPAILASAKLGPAPSQLVHDGLLRERRPLIEDLLSFSRLEMLGLVRGGALLQAYREYAAKSRVPPGFWQTLTAEIWLRTMAKL